MKTLKIYLAGPMTGLPGLNFAAFHAAALWLRGMGHTVINPTELNTDPDAEWHACMRMDIAALVTCDTIYLLPGWEDSRGAKLEHDIAERLGMAIVFVPAHITELQRLRGEASVMRELLGRCRDVIQDFQAGVKDSGRAEVPELVGLEDKITLAIRGVA